MSVSFGTDAIHKMCPIHARSRRSSRYRRGPGARAWPRPSSGCPSGGPKRPGCLSQPVDKKLLVTKGIAARNKNATNGAPGLTTSNSEALLSDKGTSVAPMESHQYRSPLRCYDQRAGTAGHTESKNKTHCKKTKKEP